MDSKENQKDQAIKLISIDSLGRIILNFDALHFIKTIQKPLAILCIAGPYRTGKSSILNSILETEGFKVGQTTKACTKGLWIWRKPILAETQTGEIANVLLMDTEGFNSCSETEDKRLIILALLISNTFMYNSIGVIDK